MILFQDIYKKSLEDEEKPIIETKTVTYKIEQYEDKRIIKIKACKNNNEIIDEQKE